MVHRTPSFLPYLYPSLIWRMPAHEKALYLTFDDGPVPGPTEFVLETLKKFDCIATFFCIGENIRKHPEVFRKILELGHTVGNHTFNHLNGWKTSADNYCQNIRQCKDEIESQFNMASDYPNCSLFRPPYGRITRHQIKSVTDYKIIMWDVLSIDYSKNISPEKCLRNTIAATRSGSIIVFHDSYKAEKNLTFALPRFIEHYLNEGFTFKEIKVV